MLIHEWFVSGKALSGVHQKLPLGRLFLIELDGNIKNLIVGFEGNIKLEEITAVLDDGITFQKILACYHNKLNLAR